MWWPRGRGGRFPRTPSKAKARTVTALPARVGAPLRKTAWRSATFFSVGGERRSGADPDERTMARYRLAVFRGGETTPPSPQASFLAGVRDAFRGRAGVWGGGRAYSRLVRGLVWGKRARARDKRARFRGERARGRGERARFRGERARFRGERARFRGKRARARDGRARVWGKCARVRGGRAPVRVGAARVRPGRRLDRRGRGLGGGGISVEKDDCRIGRCVCREFGPSRSSGAGGALDVIAVPATAAGR
jgi:hypothetical protein